MKEIPLAEVKDELSKYLRMAEKEEIVITRHGKPAGLLVGFKSEDDHDMDWIFISIQMSDKSADTPLVLKFVLLVVALIVQGNPDP